MLTMFIYAVVIESLYYLPSLFGPTSRQWAIIEGVTISHVLYFISVVNEVIYIVKGTAYY